MGRGAARPSTTVEVQRGRMRSGAPFITMSDVYGRCVIRHLTIQEGDGSLVLSSKMHR